MVLQTRGYPMGSVFNPRSDSSSLGILAVLLLYLASAGRYFLIALNSRIFLPRLFLGRLQA
jgi:hypothetical protein